MYMPNPSPNVRGPNTTYIPLAPDGSRVGLIGTCIGLIRLALGLLFRDQDVGIPNSKWLRLGTAHMENQQLIGGLFLKGTGRSSTSHIEPNINTSCSTLPH